MTTKGALVAAMVAGLFTAATPMVASASRAKVHCEGVNACKGKGGCKGADNACKGQNGCKGKGWSGDVREGVQGQGRPSAVFRERRRRASSAERRRPEPHVAGRRASVMQEFPHLGTASGCARSTTPTCSTAKPRGRLVRGHHRELHGRRRPPAARAARGARAATRSCCTASRCRSARPIRSTRTTSTSWRRSPPSIEPAWISDHLCWTGVRRPQRPRSAAAAVHRGGAGARRRARSRGCRTGSGAASSIENVSSYLDLRALGDARVGVPRGGLRGAPTAASCSTSTTST